MEGDGRSQQNSKGGDHVAGIQRRGAEIGATFGNASELGAGTFAERSGNDEAGTYGRWADGAP